VKHACGLRVEPNLVPAFASTGGIRAEADRRWRILPDRQAVGWMVL
jgi:hypothetical protein